MPNRVCCWNAPSFAANSNTYSSSKWISYLLELHLHSFDAIITIALSIPHPTRLFTCYLTTFPADIDPRKYFEYRHWAVVKNPQPKTEHHVYEYRYVSSHSRALYVSFITEGCPIVYGWSHLPVRFVQGIRSHKTKRNRAFNRRCRNILSYKLRWPTSISNHPTLSLSRY